MSKAYYPKGGAILKVLFEDFAGGLDATPYVLEVIPREIEINRNSHREADTFRLVLDYRDFPLDPRTLRYVHVRILLGDAGDPALQLFSNIPKYQAFIGYADLPETMLDDSGGTVTLEGRDYTGQLLDTIWPSRSLDIAKPLSTVITDILSEVPGYATSVITEFSLGTASLVLSSIIGKTKFSPEQNDDAWTVLADLCGRAGLIPVFNFDRLQILSATDFSSQPSLDTGIAQQYGGRQLALTYGRDVAKLSFKRRFNEWRTRQIEVRCWDSSKKLASSARYPLVPIVLKKRISPTGDVTQEAAPILPFYVSGTYTPADLANMAKQIYEEAARKQIEGVVETAEMVDRTGLVNIPLLGNGDSIKIQLSNEILTDIAGMSPGEAIAFLTRPSPRSLLPSVAQALVASFEKAESLAAQFYIQEAKHRWSRDQGYQGEFRFINYV